MKKRSFPKGLPDRCYGAAGSFYRKYIAPWEWLIFAVLLTGLAIALRAFLFGFQSNDYTNFLKPWYDKIKAGGGYRALGSELGSDYTPFYLFFLATLTYLPVSPLTGIKLFSCLFDFVTAGLRRAHRLSHDLPKTAVRMRVRRRAVSSQRLSGRRGMGTVRTDLYLLRRDERLLRHEGQQLCRSGAVRLSRLR